MSFELLYELWIKSYIAVELKIEPKNRKVREERQKLFMISIDVFDLRERVQI